MKSDARRAVYHLFKVFAQKTLQTYDVEKLKRAYPFHRLFFDELGLVAAKQERSIVTKMGQSLYPELARLIAIEKYSDVMLEQTIDGTLNVAMVNKIDEIVRDLRARQRRPNHAQEMAEILGAAAGAAEKYVRVIADVYIGDFEGGPFFAELKTPQPNLDICAESKSKILTVKTLLREQHPKAYLAFYYNPFITRVAYAHSFTKQIMDMQTEVLMGEEFWDAIGGSGTFSQILEIIDQVGNEIREEKGK
jgi:hypothetical protein